MFKSIVSIMFFLFLISCSEDESIPVKPLPEGNISIYSLLDIDENSIWQYEKKIKIQNNPWEDSESEYGKFEIVNDTSSFFNLFNSNTNEKTVSMDLSYDSTSLYMNTFSVGDNFIDPILKKLDFERVKVADLNKQEWSIDTLFYEDIAVDEKNTFFGYIAFKANRLSDSTVSYKDSTYNSKRFQLQLRIIANQKEQGYFLTVYPAYNISLVNKLGIYRLQLINHTNTAVKVEEFDYILNNKN